MTISSINLLPPSPSLKDVSSPEALQNYLHKLWIRTIKQLNSVSPGSVLATDNQGKISASPILTLDTDGALSANSDSKIASQKATKTYADTKLAKTANLSDVADAGEGRDNLSVEYITSRANVKDPYYGAKGDGVTSDRIAIQKALNEVDEIYLPPVTADYVIDDYLEINRNKVGIVGVGNASKIRSTSLTEDILRITGAVGALIENNYVKNVLLTKGSPTPTTGIGIKLYKASVPHLSNIEIRNCVHGVSISNTNNLLAEWVKVFRTAGNDTCYGFFFDGSAANPSTILRRCITYFPGQTGTNYGIYLYGANIKDIFIDTVETSECMYGYYLGSGGANNYDIHIRNPIVDQFTNSGIYIGNNTTSDNMMVSILGGWTNPKATGAATYNINVVSASGVSINGGHQLFAGGNYDFARGLYLNGVYRVKSIGNHYANFLYPISGGGTNLLNQIIGNDFDNVSGQPATTMINGVSFSRGIINDNTFDGYATNGIVLDVNSGYNEVLGNVFHPANITNKITNGGTGNEVAHNIVV